MFRSAFVAVLAVALSSNIAAAQSADPQSDVDILSQIGFDVTPLELDIDVLAAVGFDITAPEPVEIAVVASDLALTELAYPASPAFFKNTESLFSRHLDRAHDLFDRARLNVMTMARTRPRFGLYAAQGALQALDILTTSRALNAGHREANPLFKSGNRSAMVLAKSASFGLHVFLTERLAERRPKAAKWLMVATNAFMSVVVVNNLAVGESR